MQKEKPSGNTCIFCNIVNGKEKSNKLWENERFAVILDAFPVSEGHVLIIPKGHKKDILDLSESETSEIFNIARKSAKIIIKQLEADTVNVVTAPSVVPHFHIHVIPRYMYDMMGPLADLDNKRELPAEVMERITKTLKEGFNAFEKI